MSMMLVLYVLKKFINVLLEKLGNIFNPTTSKPRIGWKSILNYQFHIYIVINDKIYFATRPKRYKKQLCF